MLGSTRGIGWLAVVFTTAAGCAVDTDGFPNVASGSASAGGTDNPTGGSASGSTGASVGSGTAADSGTSNAPSTGTAADASGSDTGAVASSDSGGTDDTAVGSDGTTDTGTGTGECGGRPLDAQLDVPPGCRPSCEAIGSGSDCAGITICRLKDSQTAVCESCEPCGNLQVPCTASSECDILFTCFMGQCTAMCDFDTPQTCGNPAACTDVGHPTHGVCDPTM